MTSNVHRCRLAVLLGLVVLSAGCFGPMNATRKLHATNRGIEERWGGEGVYVVLWLVPAYLGAVAGDLLIFNTMQFWGGENPIVPPSPRDLRELEELDEDRHG
jgi:hypothetical protein